jgi:hypothetical protein
MLKQAVEEAVYEAAPDVVGVEVEGLPGNGVATPGRIPLPLV